MATIEAIRRLPARLQSRGPTLRALDLGCGVGRRSLALARELSAEVYAVDSHRATLNQLEITASAAGLDFRITTLEAALDDLEALPKPVDLIWAETRNLTEALSLWRGLLDPHGAIIVESGASKIDDATVAAGFEVRDHIPANDGKTFLILTLAGAATEPTRLCRLDDIPDGGSNGFVRETNGSLRGYMVIRRGDAVFVYVNSCPHIGLPLDLKPGRFLNAQGDRILCTTHGALFRIEDGHCVSGPCIGDALKAVPATIRDGDVHIPA